MSRAFTSEEYEVPDMPVIEVREEVASADHDLVSEYSRGRSVTDPTLPFEIGMNFLNGKNGFFRNDEFAVKWLGISSGMGHVPAMVALARVYLSDTKRYGYGKPAGLLKAAIEKGSPDAVSMLDMSMIKDVRTKAAFVKYRLNAELGNVDAMIALAEGFEKEYYARGKWRTALGWYLRAYNGGAEDLLPRIEGFISDKSITLTEEESKFLRRPQK